jgi:hypothetical protein
VSRVEIVIDELVVRGLSPEAARRAATQLEARLAELADAPGAGIASREEAFRRLAPLDAETGSLGSSVADAVWGALAGGTSR